MKRNLAMWELKMERKFISLFAMNERVEFVISEAKKKVEKQLRCVIDISSAPDSKFKGAERALAMKREAALLDRYLNQYYFIRKYPRFYIRVNDFRGSWVYPVTCILLFFASFVIAKLTTFAVCIPIILITAVGLCDFCVVASNEGACFPDY